MRYIFENENTNNDLKKEIKYSKYNKWMKSILKRAEEVGKVDLPICSLILDDRGRCIGRGVNRRNVDKDPLGHAEIMALRQASMMKNDWRFNECVLIVNLEPCTMCAGALIQSRMGMVIYSTEDSKRGGLGGTIDLSKHKSSHHKMRVIKGIYRDESKKLLKDWFKELRNVR